MDLKTLNAKTSNLPYANTNNVFQRTLRNQMSEMCMSVNVYVYAGLCVFTCICVCVNLSNVC